MYEDVRWAPRLADIPEVGFPGSPDVDRTKLDGHALKPSREQGYLMWETKDGWTSETPAAAHRPAHDDKPVAVIRKTWECLELPGTAASWHFALQGASDQLWRLRTREPEHLAVCEQFCRIDISLVQARPEPLWRGNDTTEGFVRISTFDILIKLLIAVDDLDEALRYARLAATCGQETEGDTQEIEAKLGAGV